MTRMRTSLAICALALAGLGAAPGAASADDASIRRAVCANDAEFNTLGNRTARARRAFVRRGYRRPGRLLDALADTRRLLAHTREGIVPQQPSSEGGAQGKRLYLASFTAFDRGLLTERTGVRRSARNRRPATRVLDLAFRRYDRALRLERRAKRIFEDLGITAAASGCMS